MSEVDEEVYTTIFNALRHGVRRRILRMLSETPMTFTSINEKLSISSSHLTYHLDSLKELVSKNDSRYRLSVFGRAAVDMMNGIEDPPKEFGSIPVRDSFKLIAGILLVALITLSALHVDLNNRYVTQEGILAQKDIEIASSAAEIEKLQANARTRAEYSYVIKLNSEPHLARGGNCYYTIDITMLNEGMSDINVKLENVRIYDITYYNMTVDVRGYDIIPDDIGYVLVSVNSTQSIRYVTGEVVHDSIFYVRIEFTLHIHELDKVERISTWLHRKLVTS